MVRTSSNGTTAIELQKGSLPENPNSVLIPFGIGASPQINNLPLPVSQFLHLFGPIYDYTSVLTIYVMSDCQFMTKRNNRKLDCSKQGTS